MVSPPQGWASSLGRGLLSGTGNSSSPGTRDDATGPPLSAPHAGPGGSEAKGAPALGRVEPEVLETVLRLTSARIAYVNEHGRFLYATPAVGRAAGVPSEQLIGHTLQELGGLHYAPDQIDALTRRMLETGKAAREVLTGVDPADDRATELVFEPVCAADGAVVATVVTAWDVTELTRASRRVAQLDRIYAILSGTDKAIVRIRDRGRILQEVCRIAVDLGGFALAWVGLEQPNGDVVVAGKAGRDEGLLNDFIVSTRDEPSGHGAVGTAIREDRTVVIGDVEHDARMDAWRAQLANLGFLTAAAFPIRMGGRPIGAFVLYSAQPGYFDLEETGLFEELASDLSFALESLDTERGRAAAEQALRDSERRHRQLFEQNPIPMWVFDVDTLRFLAVNDAALVTYGYSREEFLDMTLRDIRPAEDVPALLEDVAKPAGDLRPRGLWRHVRKDGTILDVEVSAHELSPSSGRTRMVSAIDVTERRRLEAQLAEAARMEAMGHLAGGIAHDFNNMLTAVIGYSDLLVAELGDSPLAEEAREIRRAGTRAADLTRQVLAFARRQVLAPRPVDVNAVVEGVSQMLRRLIGEQVRLVTKLAAQPAVVMADPGQLEQVLVNLAINARDAMPDGGVLEIGVELVEDAASLGRGLDGRAVLVTVTDSGTGMDAETLSRAFEPFFTTKNIGRGTGLGLATVHGIVHQSNGQIWADSDVYRGTTISILLGFVDAWPDPLGAPAPARERATSEPATILVVEDEPAVRAFVVATLERSGHRVLVAGSPAEAIALTDGLAEPIDLLLTDLIMPDTNGRALAERLVAARPSMQVVLMSGYAAGLDGLPTAGAAAFLSKPFNRDELTTVVATALSEPPKTSKKR
jgi:two-component system cell cycle sensor histidine kinase/response regulator CckA